MKALQAYEFGTFRLDAADRLLSRDGQPVPLTPKAADTLLYLVEHREHTVGKQELIDNVWGGAFVEDGSLSQAIWMLRKALDDSPEGRQFIATIPKRGYRFVAPVREVSGGNGTAAGLVPEEGAEAAAPPATASDGAERSVSRRWSILATAFVVVVLLAWMAWRRPQAPSTVASSRMMLVVLPVQNLSGDPSREYVSDGLTEEIIALLGNINPARLGVIARTSSMAYKHTAKTVGEISRELSVDYVLETSLREHPGQVRFTAQLIRASDQTHMWAHSYDRPLKDVMALEGELARTIADEIRVDLAPREGTRTKEHRPVSPEAYDAFIQGRYHWNQRSAGEVRKAIEYFGQAIAREPDFAPAYAGLADSYTLLTMMRDAPASEMMPKAKDALLKALAIDDSLVNAHTVLAEVTEVFDWNWAGAEKEYQRALALDPNNAEGHHQFAIHLAAMGRFSEALAAIQQARRLDPVSPVMFTSTGWILVRARLPELAMAQCRMALDKDSKFARGHLCLGEASEAKGDLEAAAKEFLAARSLTGLTPEALAELEKAIAESGYQGYFHVRLKQLEVKARQAYVSPYDRADFVLRAGDKSLAMRWLEAAYKERSPYLVFLQIEPRMDALRPERGFEELIARIGLADVRAAPLDAHAAAAYLQ